MKYLSPFRLASYLLVVFFAGHTAVGMLAQKSPDPTRTPCSQVISAPRASETSGGFL
jgi:hypothetical protein